MPGAPMRRWRRGIYADHRDRTRRKESPRRFSGFDGLRCDLTKRSSAARGPLQTGAAAQRRHAREGSASPSNCPPRSAREHGQQFAQVSVSGRDSIGKTRLQRDGRAGLGTQRGSRTAGRKARFSPSALAAPARTADRAISEISPDLMAHVKHYLNKPPLTPARAVDCEKVGRINASSKALLTS